MRIARLSLRHFRNHVDRKLDPGPHLNLITGPNGAGKTNLLDAIHYLCMSRSFISSSDRYVVNEEESWFMVEGDFEGEIRSEFSVGCSYSRGDGKQIFVNGSALDRISDLIGMVPVVVLSPEDRKLTDEGPSERRSFLDGMISQISNSYLADLIRYNRIRKQRNRLLQEFRGGSDSIRPLLEPWNVQLVEAGTNIVVRRTEVLNRLRGYLKEQFRTLTGTDLEPGFEYRTFCEPDTSPDPIRTAYEKLLESSLEKELEREQTLTGPHRDEVVFYLGDMELRHYGSQGQHRLFSVALKMAQLFYYSDELDDCPIMLLDDVFGQLDPAKTEFLLRTLEKHPGQTFITSASEEPFRGLNEEQSSGNRWYKLDSNELIQVY